MNWRQIALILLTATLAAFAQGDGHTFVLESGDYRWLPLVIRQVPVQVEASYQVTDGTGSVHLELLPDGAFRPMQRGLAHQVMAATSEGRSGTLQFMLREPGNYRIVVANKNGARPATVTWQVGTDLDPEPTAIVLSPRRRIVTIVVSFLLFFAMVGYSGWRLKTAIRD